MKVSKFLPQINTENRVQVKKGKEAARTADVSPGGADRVELSVGSKDMQKMREILEQTPDVRTEKVRDLKDRIDRGEYQPDPRDVADRMLASLLPEDLIDI